MADTNYTVLARKWRPQLFDEVVGQEHITRTLKNAIASGRIHHAFLFIGSRGIGKTTTARILAKALNCQRAEGPTTSPCGECDNCTSITAGNNIDVIEIDGASNNGVDDVREIRDNVRMVPTSGRYKVYIIDEVHQLSTGAFNALLKTLEEPPSHAIFILATTEAHKIPATIVSRCQRYDFRRVTIGDIVQLLRRILDREGMRATDEALYAIARAAEGGVRDAESVLDELITYCDGEITFQAVFEVLGLVDWRVLHGLCDAMLAGDVARQLILVEEVVAAGKDLSQFVEEILRYFRNLLVCKAGADAELLRLPPEEIAEMQARANRFMMVKLIRLVEQFATLTNGFDSQLAQRTALEALLIKLAKVDVEVSLDSIMEKLILLGAGGIAPGGGAPAPAPVPPPRTGPNPPEAGPAEHAPTVPASPRRSETPSPVAPVQVSAPVASAPAAPASPPPAAPPRPAMPAAAPAVNAVEAAEKERARLAALMRDNPGLAVVMDVFRGTLLSQAPTEPAAAGTEPAAEVRGPGLDAPMFEADLDESDAPME